MRKFILLTSDQDVDGTGLVFIEAEHEEAALMKFIVAVSEMDMEDSFDVEMTKEILREYPVGIAEYTGFEDLMSPVFEWHYEQENEIHAVDKTTANGGICRVISNGVLGAIDTPDFDTVLKHVNSVNDKFQETQILHSFIPQSRADILKIQQYLTQQEIEFIPEILKLDLARDGHHYDILTSQVFVNQIINWLNSANFQ
jgi:hypothetical protein